jgi:iron complex outermembrane receptor protein
MELLLTKDMYQHLKVMLTITMQHWVTINQNGWNTDVSLTTWEVILKYTPFQILKTGHLFLMVLTFERPWGKLYMELTLQSLFKPGENIILITMVGNIDISKNLNDQLSLGFGSEFRTENF